MLIKQPRFSLRNWERLKEFEKNQENLIKLPKYQNNHCNNEKLDFHPVDFHPRSENTPHRVTHLNTNQTAKIWSVELENTRGL